MASDVQRIERMLAQRQAKEDRRQAKEDRRVERQMRALIKAPKRK